MLPQHPGKLNDYLIHIYGKNMDINGSNIFADLDEDSFHFTITLFN